MEGVIMIKCKLCGTANFPNSSVCAKCGAELETSWYNTDTYSNNEIFSDTKAECMPRSTEQRDLFSSGEKYEKMKGVPSGSFQSLIETIMYLANEEITVHIRFNITSDQRNIDDIRKTIEFLSNRIGFHKRIFYYPYPFLPL